MSVRLVQFGDLHLDSPLEKLSPRLAARRRALSRRLVADVVALARDRRADLIVCTGDLFDSDTPYYDSVLAAAEAFARTDVPVFLAPGNHDFYAEPSPWTAAPWSSNVHIFRTVAPETVTLAGCSVTGVASTERRRSLAPLEGFRIPAFDGPKILIFHGDVGPGGPYSHATEEQLAATGADYVALGHVHKGFIRRAGNALLVMNGSAECRGFGESGEKGAVFAELGPEGARAELVPLGGSRCFETEAADLDGSAASLEAAVRAACPWPPERTLLDLTLTGGV
ncbi:MAG: DNA repair exonuclease, partial [Oscillospiraceae bacterium]|nr:DNA repair exonuclease [Oscillospiraceae bacterium]